ncbi:hypothetical protein BDR22DRAFT_974686 [Usnea florida]
MSHTLGAGSSTHSKRRVPDNFETSDSQSSKRVRAVQIEDRILVDGRGQIRTHVTCDDFQKSFFSHLKQNVEIHPDHTGYFNIPESEKWGKADLYREVLKPNMEQMCLNLNPHLRLCFTARQSPYGSNDGKPDFLIVRTPRVQPTEGVATEGVHWKDVELVMGHSQLSDRGPAKFSQWLREARTVFDQQPYRRCCFGVIFLKPHAYLCYADHGCAAFSVPLELTQQSDGRMFLMGFLTSFLTSEDWERGRDPDIKERDNEMILQQGPREYLLRDKICHSTALIGRNLQVITVVEKGTGRKGVCKSVWEKIPSDLSSDAVTHGSECDVIKHLQDAGVRGLPEVWGIEYSKVNGAYTETAPVPNGQSVKSNMSEELLSEKRSIHVTVSSGSTDRISKSKPEKGKSSHNSKGPDVEESTAQSSDEGFYKPTNKRRQLYRLIMSECQGLREKIDHDGFEQLMPVIRDAMICYYECYKIPSPGWLQADISDNNIMATTPNTILTAQSEIRPRKGTIIDWNLSYPASEFPTSSRSGTPVFMALDLLYLPNDKDDDVTKIRTLRHDLESFFHVMLYMAMIYKNPLWSKCHFAGAFNDKETWRDIHNCKYAMLSTDKNFQRFYLKQLPADDFPGGSKFQELLQDIRRSIYDDDEEQKTSSDNKDYIINCEALFRRIMKLIDQHIGEDGIGCLDLKEIDDRKARIDEAARLKSEAEAASRN